MNMIIRILLLPLSLLMVTIAGALGTIMAMFLAIGKSLNNGPFNKETVVKETVVKEEVPPEVKETEAPVQH